MKTFTTWLAFVTINWVQIVHGQNYLTDSLIAYYPFNGNALDSSGNGNDGTVYSAALVMDRFGNANSAYYFDNNDYISYTSGPKFKPVTFPISVCLWMKGNTTDLTSGLFQNESIPNIYSGVFFEDQVSLGGVLAVSYGDGGTTSPGYRRSKIGTININDNQWHFVAAVIRGPTDMDLYIDCAYDPGYYSGSGNTIYYSNYNGSTGIRDVVAGTYYYKGSIDDIRFYHRELTLSDLQQLYTYPMPYGNSNTTVSLGDDTALCTGSVLLEPVVNGTVVSYLWSTGSIDTAITASTPGAYWVRVFDGCGYAYDTINIGKGTILPVDIGNDTTLCNGQSLTLTVNGNYPSYLWSNGAVTQSITINSAGTYYVTVTSGACSSSDTIQVSYTVCDGLEAAATAAIRAWYDASDDLLLINLPNVPGKQAARLKVFAADGRLLFESAIEQQQWQIEGAAIGVHGMAIVEVVAGNQAGHFTMLRTAK